MVRLPSAFTLALEVGSFAVLLTVSGCSNSVSPALVQTKAASDLSCASKDIAVDKVTDNNWKATGCGREVTYACSGSNFMSSGMCFREGDISKR